MLRTILKRQINRTERKIGQPADHLRDILTVSPGALFKLGLTMPVMRHRKHAPAEALHLARLVATKELDCGACVQIAINLALADDVGPELLSAAYKETWQDLPEPLQKVCAYARATGRNDAEVIELAEDVEIALGREAQVEIALALAFVPVFPYLKRALGYAVSCSQVSIERI